MAKKIMEGAPVDQIGMPLPIIYTPIPPGASQQWNEHHAFHRKIDFMSGTEAHRAVRYSRLQHVPVWHHNRLHTRYKQGLELPSEYQAFGLMLLSYAGYIPEEGIDVRKDVSIRGISRRERQEMRRPGVFVTEGPGQRTFIGRFLIKSALSYGIENAEDEMKAFIQEPTEEAAFDLIMAASEMAVEPWDEVYKMAHKQKALKNGAPTRPLRLVSRVVSTQVDNFTERVQEGIKELELAA